ncbi:hypothetical protein NC653_003082 [Populus alba x Populus x berolinensis]|nr:hypothetical protein NC653_003082 [Populus alba x Populus x berolinensis]
MAREEKRPAPSNLPLLCSNSVVNIINTDRPWSASDLSGLQFFRVTMTKSEYRGCHNCSTDYHSLTEGLRTISVLLSPDLLLLARAGKIYFEVGSNLATYEESASPSLLDELRSLKTKTARFVSAVDSQCLVWGIT